MEGLKSDVWVFQDNIESRLGSKLYPPKLIKASGLEPQEVGLQKRISPKHSSTIYP